MPYCNNCGHDNPDGSNFCGNCGAALPGGETNTEVGERRPSGDTTKTMAPIPDAEAELLTAEDEAAVNALPRGSALLIVQRGPNAGSRYLLNTDLVTVGRHQKSDIFFDDISVSRRHVAFLRTPEGTLVRDSGSLNGTYVNRELVDEMVLQHGDEVQIGKYRLVYFASPQGVD